MAVEGVSRRHAVELLRADVLGEEPGRVASICVGRVQGVEGLEAGAEPIQAIVDLYLEQGGSAENFEIDLYISI